MWDDSKTKLQPRLSRSDILFLLGILQKPVCKISRCISTTADAPAEAGTEVERSIAYFSMAGFMNNHGGTLMIGVDDQGTIVGLQHDYHTLRKENRDGFHQGCLLLTKLFVFVREKCGLTG